MVLTKGQTMQTETRIRKERMLSVDEAAKYIGLAAKTIRNQTGPRAEKPFPVKPKRIGGRVLFDIKDIDRYLDTLPNT
jgi:predicted DNA-binding transcriptional regulator AlpA